MKGAPHAIPGIIGRCGAHEVFLAFAPAKVLHSLSFADTLDENSGLGYQRPRNIRHSRDFRDYIHRPGSSTIPLTFNLRPEQKDTWRLERTKDGHATLHLGAGSKCLAQVDCQHRLGELADSPVSLAFMSFLGLVLRPR